MAFRVKHLPPDAPPDAFPDPEIMGIALGYPDGLLAIGGDLSAERLIAAYARGIFPWFNEDQPILWWSPDPRAVIEPQNFHMSRSLLREVKSSGWTYSVNNCFAEVVSLCSLNRGEYGTWITPEMVDAYIRLNQLGYAHSVESWYEGELAGGIYGIRMGNMFFGESMFSLRSNASKVAISGLIDLCLTEGIVLLDCQVSSPHLVTLGMTEIPRLEFLRRVKANKPEPQNLVISTSEKLPTDSLSRLRQPQSY
jgi:leucyl/phenylalanyl-tRNA--protein transferase